ncbi:MAG: demethylmenaquinone methyltransferase/2-methoxy-6-polyprenyl-1,4-benzoquinol methylase [Crocinitomix sp.]
MGTKVKPYNKANATKKEEVEEMFDNISGKYDFLNHFLSLGIDKLWRKKAIKILKEYQPKVIMDMATGTGDFAIEALKLNPDRVVGVDLSNGMLEVGRKKMKKKGVDQIVEMIQGDSENLSFETATFDAFTVGFGVRNFQNLDAGLTEMLRVLKTGGVGVILEFSKPKKFPVKQYFKFHSKYVIPTIGKAISKDKAAYTYLPESVEAFPEGQAFMDIMSDVGYKNVKSKRVGGGIATIYYGIK